MNKILAISGRVYRGEILHQTALGCVIVFPSWLGGASTGAQQQVPFVSLTEAQGFVDAHLVVDALFSSYSECTVEA